MLHSLIVNLPLVVCATMTVEIALSLRYHPSRHRRLLLVWAMAATLLYLCHFLFFNNVRTLIPVSDTIYTALNLTVFPLYYIYISELTDPVPLSRKPAQWLAWLLPAMAGGFAIGALYALMTTEDVTRFIDGFLYSAHVDLLTGWPLTMAIVHKVCKAIFAVQVLVVAIAGYQKVKRYNQLIDQLYTDTEERSLHSIRVLLVLVGVTAIASFAFNLIGRFAFFGSWALLVPSLLFTMLLFSIGQTGMRQNFSIQNIEPPLPASEEEDIILDQSVNDDAETTSKNLPTDELVSVFKKSVEDELLYLQPDLKLNDIARKLGTNRTYLLAALKEHMQMSFTEYINRLRIAHAQRLMAERPELTRSELAAASGYASERTFYRNLRLYQS